jgi:dTMP kinase
LQSRFITVEGGEGAGKSVFTKGLIQALTAAGIPVELTREPGGTPLADGLRELFLHPPGDDKPTPVTELFIVSAARAQHVATRIQPLLQRGTWVLCDRFYDSTRAYQGSLGGLDESILEPIIATSVGDCHPHLSFVLDCPAEVAMERTVAREKAKGRDQADLNRYDGGSRALHQQLRNAYQALAKKFPERIVMINAEEKPEAMVAEAMRVIRERWMI